MRYTFNNALSMVLVITALLWVITIITGSRVIIDVSITFTIITFLLIFLMVVLKSDTTKKSVIYIDDRNKTIPLMFAESIKMLDEASVNERMSNVEFRKHLGNLMHDTASQSNLIAGRLNLILIDEDNNKNLTEDQKKEFRDMVRHCKDMNIILDNYYLLMKESFPIERDKPKKA